MVSSHIAKVGHELAVHTEAMSAPVVVTLPSGDTVVVVSNNDIEARLLSTDVAKISDVILVNSATESDQWDPSITVLANGGFVITWTDWSRGIGGASGDKNGVAVKAQVFSTDGIKIGSEILVNTETLGDQGSAVVTPLPNGGFVVAWIDGSYSIKAQRFAMSGAKVGSEMLVNTTGLSYLETQQVTTLSTGGFVVVWSDRGSGTGGAAGDDSGRAVRAQIFAFDGSKIGSEILVNTATSSDQFWQKITPLSNGGFVVVWRDDSHGVGGATGDASGSAVKAQVFTADGTRIGSEILVNSATTNDQQAPLVATLANGGFVVGWMDRSVDLNDDVKAQVFSADGSKIGSEILVNTAVGASQAIRDISTLSDGGFVIAWGDDSGGFSGASGDSSGWAVKAQVFTADGSKVGSEILVNTSTLGDQDGAVIASLPNGRFMVAWNDSPGSAAVSTKAQFFQILPGPQHNDFDGNGSTDLLLQNSDGVVVVGEMENGKLSYASVAALGPEWEFKGNGDFSGDGHVDFLIENANGAVVLGEIENGGASYTQVAALGSEWTFQGTGRFLDNGRDQFLLENTDGVVVVGDVENGAAVYAQIATLGSEWKFVGTGDYLDAGHAQFLIENTSGAVVIGDMVNGATAYSHVASLGSEWKFVGTGDFLGAGHAQFLIENTSGAVVVGDASSGQAQYTQVGGLGPEWTFIGTGDYSASGTAGFMIENTAGVVVLGTIVDGSASYAQVGALGAEWRAGL